MATKPGQTVVEEVGDFEEAPDVWSAAAHATIPEDAWEYHIRASLKDAAYKGLDYVPYCSTMPCKPESEDVKFMWKKKGAH
mmetsp:Transcript_1660/g.4824  ORF Transcript_1660/g.4824 Transcript_1660/m.4824 type:complete len:81 (+) Transcript_1660:82-324(+)